MYQKGKVYTIRSYQTDKIYIGCTVQPLNKRIGKHRGDYKSYLNGTNNYISSFKLLEHGDAYIELHENYPCNSREELQRREGEVIREYKENCVNMIVQGRTKKEYREDNIEKIKKRDKEYYEINKKQLKEKMKEYREANKKQILERKREKIICECGSQGLIDNMRRHERTLKHLTFMNSKNTE